MDLVILQDQIAQCNGKAGDIIYWLWEIKLNAISILE